MNGLNPDIIKSCSNCKQKKVKCTGNVPSCNRCKKWNLECDMAHSVFYNHSTIQSILEKIRSLEDELKDADVSAEGTENIHLDGPDTDNETMVELEKEVGTLTSTSNTEGRGKYIGAATGSNFAKSFLKQMQLQKLDNLDYMSTDDFSNSSTYFSTACASLPPYRLAKLAFDKYINHIHFYYPVFTLRYMFHIVQTIYKSPESLSFHEKYLVFMIIALGLERGETDPELTGYYNQFRPIEFFNTAKKYLEILLENRSALTLQELILLIIWISNTNVFLDDNGDSWHLGRYMMTLAMEFDMHKSKTDENLSEAQAEINHRLFWATYILERSNAVKFGRGLSLRKEFIETQLAKFSNEDVINNEVFSRTCLKNYLAVQFKPSFILIDLYEVYGVLLETIYISRTRGSRPLLSIETIIEYKHGIQDSVEKLLVRIDNDLPSSITCHHELKIKTYMCSIISNRPSPSFPSPDRASLLKCKTACIESVKSFSYLVGSNWKPLPTFLHDLVNIGLTMIYSCWKTEPNSELLKKFSRDIVAVMDLTIRSYPSFVKFKNLFIIVSSIILQSLDKPRTFKHHNKLSTKTSTTNDNNSSSKTNTPELYNANSVFSDVPSPLQFMRANVLNQTLAQNHPIFPNNPFSGNYSSPVDQRNGQNFKRKLSIDDAVSPMTKTNEFPTSSNDNKRKSIINNFNKNNNASSKYPIQYVQSVQNNNTQRQTTPVMIPQVAPQYNYGNTTNNNFSNDMNTNQMPNQYPQNQQQWQQSQQNPLTFDNGAMVDSLTQELFQDVFKNYYQGNDTVKDDIDQLFEFQRFNWA